MARIDEINQKITIPDGVTALIENDTVTVKSEKGELSRIMADAGRTGTTQTKIYTIQIMSLKNAVDVSFFKNVAEVKKYDCKDGLTRYVIGEYYGIQEALNALPEVKENGYQDAFIMNVEHYKKLAR